MLGACLVIRNDALRTVGLLDSELSPVANSEEVDWCRRAWKAGWKVAFCPAGRVMHYGGQSLWPAGRRGIDRTRVEMMRTRLAYFAKHDGRWVASAAASALRTDPPVERLGPVPVVGPGADPRDQGVGRVDDPGSFRLDRGRVRL